MTLAGAVTLEQFVFRNASFSSEDGNLIPDVSIFGLDLAVREGRNIARVEFGLLVLAAMASLCILVANLARSATGRRFLAVRSNERAAASVGINVSANILLAFAFASFLAGIGGAFIGYSRGQLSAESFATLVGVSYLAFAYLGGITSVSGAIIAGISAPLGLTFVVVDRNLDLGNSYSLIAGVGLVVTAIFNPQGIAGAIRKNAAHLRSRLSANAKGDRRPIASGSEPLLSTTPTHRQRAERPDFTDAPVVLEATDVTVRYGGLMAVNEVSLKVRRGQIVGLIGPNGAGKTTFIDAITGFTRSSGSIRFAGDRIDDLAPHDRARRGLARTWQSLELFDDLSVEENLRVAAETASFRSVALDLVAPQRTIDPTNVEWALRLLRLTALSGERPTSLPLGQQKLLGVARSLASRPKIVMLDEPAAGLDTSEGQALGDRLFDIVEHGISVFLIDHDMGLVLDVCDYIYVLEFGRIIAEGTPAEVRTDEQVIAAYLGQEVM